MQLIDKILAPVRAAEGGWLGGAKALAPTLVTVVLVVALGAQLAGLLWRALTPDVTESAGYVAPGPAAAPAIDLGSIVNAHLFGLPEGAPGELADAPASNANLVLAGTLAGIDAEQGWAIVGPSAAAGRVYATGTTLPGGGRLVAVYPDRIIVERNGRRESVSLPRLSGGAGATPIVYSGGQVQQSSLADGVRELLAQDPAAFSEVMRPQPVFAGGQQRGYRVYPGRNRDQFAQMGLQPGDLVTAINGTPLDDPNRGLETLRGVAMGGSVTLTIERNGQAQQLSVDSSSLITQAPPVSTQPQMAPVEQTE